MSIMQYACREGKDRMSTKKLRKSAEKTKYTLEKSEEIC